jgi:alpha-glucosidase
VQDGDPASVLTLYRAALKIRAGHPALGDGGLEWLEAGDTVLAFRREPGFACWVNLGSEPVSLPHGATLLLASQDLNDGQLPPDTAAWLTV